MGQRGNLRIIGKFGRDLNKYKDPLPVKIILITITFLFFIFILILPLVLVFSEAFKKGIGFYFLSLKEPAAFAAIKLTLLVAAIVVPINAVFGIMAAWAIARFEFPGKTFLTTLLDLPFAVSPVVAGLIFVLLLGAKSPFGAWLIDHGLRIIFAPPGIIIATLFVTFPFVARELIPLMQSQGQEEEEAAMILGAGGWKTFWKAPGVEFVGAVGPSAAERTRPPQQELRPRDAG